MQMQIGSIQFFLAARIYVECVFRNMAPRLVGVTVYPSPARLITGGGRKEGRNEARDHPCLVLPPRRHRICVGAGGREWHCGRTDREGWDGLSIIHG